MNEQRSAQGLSPLSYDSELTKLAQLKAEDMAENNYFSHQSPTYGSAFDMMRSAGVSHRSAGGEYRKRTEDAGSRDGFLDEFSGTQREYPEFIVHVHQAWDMRWMTAEEPAGFRFSKDRQTGDGGRQAGWERSAGGKRIIRYSIYRIL